MTITTEPLFDSYNLFCEDGVNNSTLSNLKKILLGERLFFGNEKFLAVGRELHQRVLEPHLPWNRLDPADEVKVMAMMASLASHKQFSAHLKGAKCEVLRHGFVHGVYMRGTLDMDKKRKGGDIKTSACTSLLDFHAKAIEYGYPRQGYIYSQLANLNDFIFYGVQKQWPYKVMVMDLKDFKPQVNEAKKELDYLLHVYKNYVLDRHKGAETILAKAIAKNKT